MFILRTSAVIQQTEINAKATLLRTRQNLFDLADAERLQLRRLEDYRLDNMPVVVLARVLVEEKYVVFKDRPPIIILIAEPGAHLCNHKV